MINDKVDEIIKELLDLLKNRYQNNLESMKNSEFVFVYVQLLYYKCHKINLNRGGSYIDSPELTKNKLMFSIRCNSCVKPWRNKKKSAKNNKN